MIDLAYKKSIEVLRKNSISSGLFASKSYDGIWTRDSIISFLGLSLINENFFKKIFKENLKILKKYQTANGQIPNAVDIFSKRKPHIDYGSIDSTLWFIIGVSLYKKRYDEEIFKDNNSIKKALTWLSYQDMGNDLMLEQLPTTDWQDAFPHKYGHTINTQALYYYVLKLSKKNKEAQKLKKVVNSELWKNNFYLAYKWKSHNKYLEEGNWFDSLGNLMAIIFGLTDKNKSKKILDYIKSENISKPWPIKSIYPPINKNSKYWKNYFLDCEAGTPNHYLNGGIWPFIGGFYLLALIKLKKFNSAKKQLKFLAELNLKYEFPEWIDPITKKGYGKNQSWNAGMYILAYNSIKKKKCLF